MLGLQKYYSSFKHLNIVFVPYYKICVKMINSVYGVRIGLSRTFSLFHCLKFRSLASPLRSFALSLIRTPAVSHRLFVASQSRFFAVSLFHIALSLFRIALSLFRSLAFSLLRIALSQFRIAAFSLFRTSVVSYFRCFVPDVMANATICHFLRFVVSHFRCFILS